MVEPRYAILHLDLTDKNAESRSGKMAWAATPPLVRTVGRLAWRLRFELLAPFPDPPFVVASNHHSFLDPFLVGTAYGSKIRYIALQDLFGNYGWVDFMLNAYDAIPTKRGVVPLGPVREALRHLADDGIIGVFPEGTRHDEFDPTRVRRGAAWLATRAAVPLVPIAIAGSEQVLGVDNRLRRGRIKLTVGEAIYPMGPDRADIDGLTRRWADWVSANLE